MPRYPALCALALLIIWVFAPAGCGKRDSSNGDSDSGQTQKQDAGWFIEIASESGLDFVHQSGVQGDYFMPEIVGSGGAIFDYDNDGDLDVYLVNSGSLAGKQDSRNRLFRQSPDGRFSDATEEAGVGDPGYLEVVQNVAEGRALVPVHVQGRQFAAVSLTAHQVQALVTSVQFRSTLRFLPKRTSSSTDRAVPVDEGSRNVEDKSLDPEIISDLSASFLLR